MRGKPPRALALDQGRDFVAEAEDAAWLQADDRHAARYEGLGAAMTRSASWRAS